MARIVFVLVWMCFNACYSMNNFVEKRGLRMMLSALLSGQQEHEWMAALARGDLDSRLRCNSTLGLHHHFRSLKNPPPPFPPSTPAPNLALVYVGIPYLCTEVSGGIVRWRNERCKEKEGCASSTTQAMIAIENVD